MSERLEDINFIKDGLNTMSQDELKRTLAYLIKVYVLDSSVDKSSSNSRMPTDKNISFFDLITAMKAEYRTPELSRFELESGKVFIEINNRAGAKRKGRIGKRDSDRERERKRKLKNR